MMQEKATGAKQQITARVSPDIREDIERRQRAGGRSVSDVVEAVYRAGMKAEAVGAQQRTAAPVIAHEVRELMIDAEQRIVGQVREAVGAAVASETMVLREDQLTVAYMLMLGQSEVDGDATRTNRLVQEARRRARNKLGVSTPDAAATLGTATTAAMTVAAEATGRRRPRLGRIRAIFGWARDVAADIWLALIVLALVCVGLGGIAMIVGDAALAVRLLSAGVLCAVLSPLALLVIRRAP
jgi:protein required for attachment to host cells